MSVRRVVPDLRSTKFDASRDFYTSVFGFLVGMDLGWIMTFVSPTDPKAQLTIIKDDATAPMRPQVSIQVDDVDAVHAEAVKHDARIVYPVTDEPWGVRRFFVEDPNGVVINVLSHRRGAARDEVTW